jgi:hypothetical protein
VAAGLERLLDETDADELMISTSTYELADRLRSYELVARLFAPLAAGTSAAAR